MAKMNIPLHSSPVFQGGEEIKWVDEMVCSREQNSKEQSSKPDSVIN